MIKTLKSTVTSRIVTGDDAYTHITLNTAPILRNTIFSGDPDERFYVGICIGVPRDTFGYTEIPGWTNEEYDDSLFHVIWGDGTTFDPAKDPLNIETTSNSGIRDKELFACHAYDLDFLKSKSTLTISFKTSFYKKESQLFMSRAFLLIINCTTAEVEEFENGDPLRLKQIHSSIMTKVSSEIKRLELSNTDYTNIIDWTGPLYGYSRARGGIYAVKPSLYSDDIDLSSFSFKNAPALSDIRQSFAGIKNLDLSKVNPNMLSYNSNLYDVIGMFAYIGSDCTSATLLPENFFDNCPALTYDGIRGLVYRGNGTPDEPNVLKSKELYTTKYLKRLFMNCPRLRSGSRDKLTKRETDIIRDTIFDSEFANF